MHTQEITQDHDSGWDWILLANNLATDITTHMKPTRSSRQCTPWFKMANKKVSMSRLPQHLFKSVFSLYVAKNDGDSLLCVYVEVRRTVGNCRT